jgi:uncharacterized protein YndB with AHSA1/START domain
MNDVQDAEVRVTRVFHASRAQVFDAWSSAEALKRWFSPDGLTVPHARVEMRPGGAFEVCMRNPAGTDHWGRGRIVETDPPNRLVIDMDVETPDGVVAMVARTHVDFEQAVGGTRVSVRQTWDVRDPAAAQMIAGAQLGWEQTIDRLGREVARAQAATAIHGHVVHDAFTVERTYPATRAQLWRALTDQAAKARWFGGEDPALEVLERSMDVRPGGRERLRARHAGGEETLFDAVYFDVVAEARLVWAYDMWLGERKISVSLASLEISEAPGGVSLKMTEQGAFLDGYDDAGSRAHGTAALLDRLGATL